MQHEDTGVDFGWLRVGSSVQDIRGRRVPAVLEACWDRRGQRPCAQRFTSSFRKTTTTSASNRKSYLRFPLDGKRDGCGGEGCGRRLILTAPWDLLDAFDRNGCFRTERDRASRWMVFLGIMESGEIWYEGGNMAMVDRLRLRRRCPWYRPFDSTRHTAITNN